MMTTRLLRLGVVWIAAAIGLLPAVARAQDDPIGVRGVVEALHDATIVVKTREGPSVEVHLAPDWGVSQLVRADLADIKVGTYIGTAAEPRSDGTLEALEVLIFPEAMRGAGEGHRRWDLKPRSSMTNATVDAMVTGVKERILTLAYKDGGRRIIVPEDVPIVTPVPGDASMVVPGAPVFILTRKQPDGTLAASRVTVGKDGLVPPM